MDAADRAQRLEEEERSAMVRRIPQPLLELPKLIDGERVCRDCEEPIAPARLTALPRAVRCAVCEERREMRG